MANPVTHILIPMFIVETYRRYFCKKGFSRWYVFLAGFLGGAPDLDFIYSWLVTGTMHSGMHRGVTHSMIIPILTLVVGVVLYLLYTRKVIEHEGIRTAYIVMFVATIGLASHVVLDGLDGMKQWFYPLAYSIDLPNLIMDKYRAGMIDGILLFLWLLYDKELFDDIIHFLKLKK